MSKYIKKQWEEALKTNTFKVVHIRHLPEGAPVLAVTEFANKSLAEFHLTDKVLVPKSFIVDKPQIKKP